MENEQVKDREVSGSSPTTALTTQASPDQMTANMARMKQMIELKKRFLQENLSEGLDRDYAKIPGTAKLSILKPGGEKLADWHGIYARYFLISEKEDFEIGLFSYVYKCVGYQKGTNNIVGECEGDASSWESKYRFEWKYESELPGSLDKDQLARKRFGEGDKAYYKYQVVATNLADRRNTVRKMAQKRAFLGMVISATATSDLFAADIDPDDPEGSAGAQNTGDDTGHGQPHGDYGNPISDKQGKRLYAIRKSANIDDATFKAWLKAKYGIEDDRTIGYKIYDEICKACESGKLEMPAAKPAAETAPASPAQPASSGTKITVPQIKDFNMLLNSLGHNEAHFKEWLGLAIPAYEGKGVNDLLSGDVDYIKEQYAKYCEGEAA